MEIVLLFFSGGGLFCQIFNAAGSGFVVVPRICIFFAFLKISMAIRDVSKLDFVQRYLPSLNKLVVPFASVRRLHNYF